MMTVFAMNIRKSLFISIYLLLTIFPLSSQANTQSSTALSSESEINYSIYKANGKHLLLWFYSEAGPQASDKVLAEKLSASGIEVWLIDLFDSYFLPVALSSMDKIPATDISEFIEVAYKKNRQKNHRSYNRPLGHPPVTGSQTKPGHIPGQ